MLDPVFLQDRDFYRRLAEKSKVNEEEPFLLAYILNPTEKIREQLSKLSRERGQKLINLTDGIPVTDWLYYLSHCDALVTDSDYGSSFALIFGKPFLCLNDRLFETLYLSERCVETPETLWEKRSFLTAQTIRKPIPSWSRRRQIKGMAEDGAGCQGTS